MMKLLLCFLLLLCAACTSTFPPETPTTTASLSLPSKNSAVTRFLATAANRHGLVDYTQLAESPKELELAYSEIALYSPESHPERFPTQEARLSYWINAYNVVAIYAVMQHYPIDSVQDYRPLSPYSLFAGGGFFASQKFLFGQKAYSLYELENKVIRKQFTDPLFHFGLNCASHSCPVLRRGAYTPENITKQLEQQNKLFLNSDRGMVIDHDQQTISISSIFKWYEEDFTSAGGSLAFIERYYSNKNEFQQALQAGYDLKHLSYDWSLNARDSPAAH